MADVDLVRRIRQLGDIDLAALLCLINREHCIISTEAEYLDDLTEELQLVALRTFGLGPVVLDCTPETTIDDLVAAIQLPISEPQPTPVPRSASPLRARGPEPNVGAHLSGANGGAHSHAQQHHNGTLRPLSSLTANANRASTSPSRASLPSTITHHQQIANVILARNLNTAPVVVQIQCLELMRTRRIFTRTAVQTCPKQFLFIAVIGSDSASSARLTRHLNNHFYISHWQDPMDGFAHLDEETRGEGNGFRSENIGDASTDDRSMKDNDDDDDGTASQASSASVVRRTRSFKAPPTPALPPTPGGHVSTTDRASQAQGNPYVTDNSPENDDGRSLRNPLFTETDISTLSTLSLQTNVDIEVQRYLMNIIVFLRIHRAVTPGSVPPAATTHFRSLVHSLAALHGLDFATPEMVQLAARKIYAHHIVIVPPEYERSIQWGSEPAAIEALLEDLQPEDVIEDVLRLVDVPV